MVPEVLWNEQYNEEADVYAYGIVLWELYTRKDPYASMKSFECFNDLSVLVATFSRVEAATSACSSNNPIY